MKEHSREYAQVAQDELDPGVGILIFRREHSSFIARYWPWAIHVVLFLTSIGISFSGSLAHLDSYTQLNDFSYITHPGRHIVRFNGTFDRSSIFKGPPSPAVDKAWDDILPLKFMVIPEPIFKQLNASKHAVDAPTTLGSGRLAIFEAIHQIHCVRALWKATYPDYYPRMNNQSDEEWRSHLDHCADMLRQKLMCDADSNLITYNWLHQHYNPHPNFHVQHRCRDYDDLLASVEQYGIPLENIPENGILRPAGESVVEFFDPPYDPLSDS